MICGGSFAQPGKTVGIKGGSEIGLDGGLGLGIELWSCGEGQNDNVS